MAYWRLEAEYGSCYDYHVNAYCSECGYKWYSRDGIGNPEYIFSAFVTGGTKEDALRFVLNQARQIKTYRFCPMCGCRMDQDTDWLEQEVDDG